MTQGESYSAGCGDSIGPKLRYLDEDYYNGISIGSTCSTSFCNSPQAALNMYTSGQEPFCTNATATKPWFDLHPQNLEGAWAEECYFCDNCNATQLPSVKNCSARASSALWAGALAAVMRYGSATL